MKFHKRGSRLRRIPGLLALLALPLAFAACGGDNDPASRLMSFRTVAIRATRVIQSATCDTGLVAQADATPTTPTKLGNTNCDTPGSYAHPGDEVQFELLWTDPDKTATHEWAWTFCVNPPSSSILGCFEKLGQDLAKLPPEQRNQAAASMIKFRKNLTTPFATIFETNELQQPNTDGTKLDTRTVFRLNVPKDALAEFAGKPPQARANAVMGVIFVACPGRLEVQLDGGDSRTSIPLKCFDKTTGKELGSDLFTIGIKRVFIREKDENADPRIASVLWDGKDWPETEVKTLEAVCATDEKDFGKCESPKHTITPQMQQPFAESGTDETGLDFNEQVVVQYYATEGLFEHDVTRAEVPQTGFAGRRGHSGEQQLWIVTRDNRGGVSWVKRRFVMP